MRKTQLAPTASLLRNPLLRSGLWIHFILVALVLYVPLFTLVLYSFNASRLALSWGGFSLKWYAKAIESPEVARAIINSLSLATISGVGAAILGTMLALALERGSQRLRKIGGILGFLPILIPELIMAIGLLLFFNRCLRPWLGTLGGSLDSFLAVILGHITLSMSYVMVLVRSYLRRYDPQTELAALDLGANHSTVLFHIILPQLMPAILAGTIMAIALSLDDFYISYFVTVGGSGFKTVPLYIWNLQGRSALTPEINAVSVLMLLASAFLVILGYTIQSKPASKE